MYRGDDLNMATLFSSRDSQSYLVLSSEVRVISHAEVVLAARTVGAKVFVPFW